MVLYGVARGPTLAVLASIIAGASWIAVLSNLNVSAQMALPEWVRARGLAVYVTVFFGAMTLGSVLWGEVSRLCGISFANYAAALGMMIAIPLTWRWKLQAPTPSGDEGGSSNRGRDSSPLGETTRNHSFYCGAAGTYAATRLDLPAADGIASILSR
jgi:hypothetical protein